MKIMVLPVCCILINKVHYSETQNFWNFVIWKGMNDAKLIFASLYSQFCLRAEAVMVARFSFIIEGIRETLEWFQ